MSNIQFPFEMTTKDGQKATVLGAMPDCRLVGFIDLTGEGFGFEVCDWDSDGSHSDPELSITLPLRIKPLTTYRTRDGQVVWTSGMIEDGWIYGINAGGSVWSWRIEDGRWAEDEASPHDLVEEPPPGTAA